MKLFYPVKAISILLLLATSFTAQAQVPTTTTNGLCSGVVADFNTNDNGFNAPSIYGSIFDSSFYYNASRGYWTDYLFPFRTAAPGSPRVMSVISPPFANPNPNGTFNVGFYYIVGNPAVDRFQVRIISVTETSMGTVTDVKATTGVQFFSSWSTPAPYADGVSNPGVPNPTPFMGAFQGNICIRLIDPDIINSPNTSFRVEVSYLINEPTFAVFDNLSIGPFNTPLPVNFIGLVATRNELAKSVDMKWDVSEEIDVQEYRVERSINGISFETAGAVPAKGKSVYTYSDNNVPTGTLYYRIKSVDIDGKFKYSGILRLADNSSSSYGNKLLVYPIPTTGDVTVQHKKLNAKSKLVITSLDGRILKTIAPTPGSSHTPVTISNLSPGVYLLRLDDENGYGEAVKLIKN
ncbi:MAG: T9SS type A sorting domain-containing protein [Chitinophagaceae bacterium]